MANNRGIEYQMTKKMFDNILSTRITEDEKKMRPHEYVLARINEEFGLRGQVKQIHIYEG